MIMLALAALALEKQRRIALTVNCEKMKDESILDGRSLLDYEVRSTETRVYQRNKTFLTTYVN